MHVAAAVGPSVIAVFAPPIPKAPLLSPRLTIVQQKPTATRAFFAVAPLIIAHDSRHSLNGRIALHRAFPR